MGGRCAWREDRPAAACPPRGPPPWRSYPFSSWPPRHGRPEIRVWGLRDSGKDVCRSGRMGAHGALGPGRDLSSCRPGPSTRIQDGGRQLISPRAAQEPQGEGGWVGGLGPPEHSKPPPPTRRPRRKPSKSWGSGKTALEPLPQMLSLPERIPSGLRSPGRRAWQVASAPCRRPRVAIVRGQPGDPRRRRVLGGARKRLPRSVGQASAPRFRTSMFLFPRSCLGFLH